MDSSKCKVCPVPERMTTLSEAATSVDQCICIATFFMDLDGSCIACPVGSRCTVAGATLSTLPVLPGFFRPANTSFDVRRCPDADENCDGEESCDQTSSGCRGTLVNQSAPCDPTLDGMYCQLCRDSSQRYYIAASGKDKARCEDCGQTLAATIGLAFAAVSSALLVVAALRRGYRNHLTNDAKTALRDAHEAVRLDNKLKVLIGFYMIASQVGSVYEVRLPQDVRLLLHRMSLVASLGISLGLETTPLSCLGLSGYISQLMFWMITPLVLVLLVVLATSMSLMVRRHPDICTRCGTWVSSGRNSMGRSVRGRFSRQGSTARVSGGKWFIREGRKGLHFPAFLLVLQKAAPASLRLLFLVYPIVTKEAFKAFSCYTFDEGYASASSWLRADVSIKCGSDVHMTSQALAVVAIIMYPVGLLLLFAWLLYLARPAIRSGQQSTLSKTIGFLHKEYSPSFFAWGDSGESKPHSLPDPLRSVPSCDCQRLTALTAPRVARSAELVEMLRRLVLVGVFVVVKPGSIEQLAFATFVVILYLVLQLMTSPFRSRADGFMAAACSLALTVLFNICLLYKYGALTQLEDLQERMTPELLKNYVVPYVSLSAILFGTCLSAFVVLALIVTQIAGAEAVRRAFARRLFYCESGEEVRAPEQFIASAERREKMLREGKLYGKDSAGRMIKQPLPTAGPFHVFLSHNWKHGQQKMRIVKQGLRDMVPGLSVFL